jgi:hypothetical protein
MAKVFASLAVMISIICTGCGLNDPARDNIMGRSQPLVSVPEPAQDIDCDLIFP